MAQIISNSTSRENSAFVSATLIWQDEFMDSDAGQYSCFVQGNDTVATAIADITLESSPNSSLNSQPLNCSVNSPVAFFQIRVLDTNCQEWDSDIKQQISRRFMDIILSVVAAECELCLIVSSDLIINTECSSQVERATVFRGTINTDESSTTEDIFCALYSWQQSGPFVLVNNSLHLVDQSCSAILESPADPECAAPPNSFNVLIISVGAVIGFVVLSIVVILIIMCACIYRMKMKQSKMEIYISAEPRSVYDR